MRRALQIAFVLSLCGAGFSGTLTWRELFAATPPALSCPAPGAAGTLLGYPACVYGFAMFALLVLITGTGLLLGREHHAHSARLGAV